ncbi:MAG: hypothetical protein M0Q26_11960 [Chitinophagaceae bacterium]|nr:hypothetical protein [Chitinophagaceae bacterium]
MKDKFNAHHFEDKEGCYEAIYEFFESFSLPPARKYLLSALMAAESKNIWKHGGPVDLLYFFERLESLVKSVIAISKRGYRDDAVIVMSSPWYTPDITQLHLFCGTYDNYMAWDYVPRALSIKEYHNPYKALEKFAGYCNKKEWREILQYIKSYALGSNSLADLSIDIELLHISQLLQKMLEACHLIYVRIKVKHTPTALEK